MNLRDFRIGWRLLVKEPAYSAVVILGLAAGIAACFLLLGFVRHSFSYDRHVPERERVFRLMERWHVAALGDDWKPTSSLPARDAALASGQPVLATAFINESLDVRAGQRVLNIEGALVDPDFAKIFRPQVLAGDLHAALTRPDALALTREGALMLFGRTDVVGRSLQSDRQTFVVAALLADPPSATTMPYRMLAGTASNIETAEWYGNFRKAWGGTPGRMYIKLLPGADGGAVLDAVRRGLRNSAFIQRDMADQVAALGGADLIDYQLGALETAYLDPDLKENSSIHGDRRLMLGLAGVAVLILLLAATNYVNLATVRVLARQREIAVRKVLGASAQAVARQFLAESVLVSLIATVIGLLLAWLLLPPFADLLQRRFDAMFSPEALLAALLFGVVLGLVTGAWPAWYALRVRAAGALAGRGGAETGSGRWLRRTLTALQFAAAMGLTGTTLAVAWQTQYASALSPGFDPASLLTFPAMNDMRDARTRALHDEIGRLPGVQAVGASSFPITFTNAISALRREGGAMTDLHVYGVTPGFFAALGLKPAAGRLYDPARDTMQDGDRIVINASAARRMGFATPQEAVGKMVHESDGPPKQVIGVAPDIRHRSARGGEQPGMFVLSERNRVFIVRSRDPVATRHAIEKLWPRHFPNETLGVAHMDSYLVDAFYADDLRLAKLLGASSAIATALAAFGIYVLAAYSVQRREREIVLRKLYGASGAVVGRLVLREFAVLVGAGAVIGLPLGWIAVQRYLGGFMERAPVGAWTLVGALLVAGMVALLSTLRHALAAVRIRPALALRE